MPKILDILIALEFCLTVFLCVLKAHNWSKVVFSGSSKYSKN